MFCGHGRPYICEPNNFPCKLAEAGVTKMLKEFLKSYAMPDFSWAPRNANIDSVA